MTGSPSEKFSGAIGSGSFKQCFIYLVEWWQLWIRSINTGIPCESTMQVRIFLEVMSFGQTLQRIELVKSFPCSSANDAKMLVVVNGNVADTVDLIQHSLHLALIGFDKVLKHLLCSKRNFRVIARLLKSLLHVSLIDKLSDTHIVLERIVGFS